MALILILNDDALAAQAMARRIEDGGHQVRCCSRPFQALRLNRLLRFDLFWMAVPLLGPLAGDPLALMRRLHHLRPDMPIVVEGGDEMEPELRRQLKAYGASVFLRRDPKPHLVLGVVNICTRKGIRKI